MATTVTNKYPFQASRSQAVKITLDPSEIEYLSQINIGDQCTIDSTGVLASIYSIDKYGNSFMVTPVQPDQNCSGTVAGYLYTNDTLTITNL